MSEVHDLGLIVHHEDDHVWAEVEEYPGCFASGDNLDELREALEEALSMYLAPSEAERRRVILEIMPAEPPHTEHRHPARAELVTT